MNKDERVRIRDLLYLIHDGRLGKKIHVRTQTVQRWRLGTSVPSSANLIRLAEAFKIDASQIDLSQPGSTKES